MSLAEVVFRPFEPGDERAVNDTFNEVFSLSRSLAEWNWKFPPRPEGRPIMLAFAGEELLAQYAAVPATFQVDDAEWAAAQIVDVFAARRGGRPFTRRSVWSRTAERFFAELGESGRYPLLYGFPGRRALRLGALQLGYDAMPPQEIVYLRRSGGARMHRLRRLAYRAEAARDWEPRLDDLWRRVRGDYPVAVVRDAERALYRLAGHPAVRYHRFLVFPRLSTRPVGFAAFRTDGGVCRWVELVWDHGHPGALALVSVVARRLAVRLGADTEELWLNGDPAGEEILVGLGFERRPEPSGLVLVARSFSDVLDVRRLDGRIYLTMADADLV